MKIAIGQITTLTKDMETDAVSFREAGFNNIELAFPKIYQYLDTHSIEDLKVLLDDNGLRAVSVIGMAPTQAGILYANGDEAETYFSSLTGQIEICHRLGCGLVTLGSDPDSFQYESWENQAIKNLYRAGKIASAYGIQIALEDGNLSRSVKLVDAVNMENVGYCIDFFWYLKHGQASADFNEINFNKLLNVHFCDLPEGFNVETMADSIRVLPGEGVLPLMQWAKRMKDAGYEGYLCLELLNEDIWNMPADKATRRCMEAMRPFLEI